MTATTSFKNSSKTTQLSSTLDNVTLFGPSSFGSAGVTCSPAALPLSIDTGSTVLIADFGRDSGSALGWRAGDHGPLAIGEDACASRLKYVVCS